MKIKIKGGYLVVKEMDDGTGYRGVSIDFEPDKDDKRILQYPSVIVEQNPEGELNAYIFNNPNCEDYTDKITFRCFGGRKLLNPNVMIKSDNSGFYCDCGCNVFSRYEENGKEIYVCHSCQAEYEEAKR